MATCDQEILEIVREMPGLTAREIYELCSHRPYSSVTARLSTLPASGAIRAEKDAASSGRAPFRYYIGDGIPPQPSRSLTAKAPSSISPLVDALRAEVSELKSWKADAMARFPELAVDPAIMRARRIAAQAISDKGDPAGAAAIRSGNKDSSPIMAAVLAALEEREQLT